MLHTLRHIIFLPEKSLRHCRIVFLIEEMGKCLSPVDCSERVVLHGVQTCGHGHGLEKHLSVFHNFSKEHLRIRILGRKDIIRMIFLP